MSLPVFDDFDKDPRDLLDDDYKFKQTLKTKHSCTCGVTTTSEVERVTKDDSTSLNGSVSFKGKYENFSLDKLKYASNGLLSTETSLTGLSPGLKLTFEGDTDVKGTAGLEYNHEQFTFDTHFDAVGLTTCDSSLLFSFDNIMVGGQVNCNLPVGGASFGLGDYTLGVGYNNPSYFVGYRTTNLKDHSLTGQYVVDNKTTVGLQGDCNTDTKQHTVTVGGKHTLCPNTDLFVKANSIGVLSTAVNKKLCCEGVSTNVSLEANVKDLKNSFKYGVGFTLS